MADNTKRFFNRVDDYIKYRPTYPAGLVNTLEEQLLINNSKVIADVGCGTGISCIPFLRKLYKVTGVEPNKEMREAAENTLATFVNFTCVDGTAEATNLQAKSVDVIFSAQAFHW